MNSETCWTLISAVRRGEPAAREHFAERYLAPVRAYLRARWRGGALLPEAEDATQEVFLRCFAEGGALDGLRPIEGGGFRGFLYGICRNVAREHEGRRGVPERLETGGPLPEVDERLSSVFDRAFARQVMKEARARYGVQAESAGPETRRRFELLALRFEEGLAIRDIAQRWSVDAARLHKEYARARREFRAALLEVVAEQNPSRSPAEVEDAAKHLVELIS